MHSESEVPGLLSSRVDGQTLVPALVPQSGRFHLHHLTVLGEQHMGVTLAGQHPAERGWGAEREREIKLEERAT